MLWSPRLSLSNFHVKLTAKGLFRNLQLLPGCRKNTVVFHAADEHRPPPPRSSCVQAPPSAWRNPAHVTLEAAADSLKRGRGLLLIFTMMKVRLVLQGPDGS
uniref:Uncharacterized protein n=1 Tax=Oryzias sinensis TaxID=183150 RepID=A0A8C7Z9A4_9TELE